MKDFKPTPRGGSRGVPPSGPARSRSFFIYNLTHKFLIFFDYQWLEAAMVIESLFLMHYWRIADNDAAKRHLKA